jgi:surface protein
MPAFTIENVKDYSYMFNNCPSLEVLVFNDPYIDIMHDEAYDMFYKCNPSIIPDWYYNIPKHFIPKTREELVRCIINLFSRNIYNLNCIDVSNITDFSWLFGFEREDGYDEYKSEEDVNIHNYKFDILRSRKKNAFWGGCIGFSIEYGNDKYKWERVNISKWNVSNGENFSYMFRCQERFKSDISNWDVSKGINFEGMFYNCKNFNQDISRWNVSKNKDFYEMFYNCKNFNQNISNWDVSNARIFSGMFRFCENFNQDIGNWDVSKGEFFSEMFYFCKNFNQDLSKWKIKKSLRKYQVKGMFGSTKMKYEYLPAHKYIS